MDISTSSHISSCVFFGKLKEELSKYITGFEMALEVCLKTGVNTVVFIDIAVWYNGIKHAIEVHGDKKKA